MNRSTPALSARRIGWAVAFVSAGVLGFEIAIMRILLIASWHHFAFVVISIALLGFGTSGTALCFMRTWLLARPQKAMCALALATSVSLPVLSWLALSIPIETHIVPALLLQQAGQWLLLWILLMIPFILGAATIGLGLMIAETNIGRVYAGNLVGSGAGALLMPFFMGWIAPPWLPALTSVPPLLAAVLLIRRPVIQLGALAAAASVAALCGAFFRPSIRSDPFKFLAQVQRLEEQGTARRLAGTQSARGLIECYASNSFHHIPFLAMDTLAPASPGSETPSAPASMHALVVDGHFAGSVLPISHLEQAAFLDDTLMSVPFELVVTNPRVLLLGETGGVNIWLALHHRASAIDVVQSDPNVIALLRHKLSHQGGDVVDRQGVDIAVGPLRHFVENTNRQYDLIQLVQLQSTAAGSSGVAGLAQNHLATVEGIGATLSRLEPEGILTVCRAMQTPPRDNIKLLATFAAAIRARGIDRPGQHITIVRDYLAVCIVVKATPWSRSQIEQIRQFIDRRELTPVWFPGVQPEHLNWPDELPAAPDGVGDWYYFAAKKLFSPDHQQFVDQWLFDIRPPTDDRPFFSDFFRLRSIGQLKQAFGDLWLTRSELAFLFVLATTVMVTFVAIALTVAPLLLLPSVRQASGQSAVAAFFGAIGLAYLLLEMTVLSRVTLIIGDPIWAGSITIAAFLVFSGLGSLTVQRYRAKLERRCWRLMITLVTVGSGTWFIMAHLDVWSGGFPFVIRASLVVLVVAPVAFLMGMPMPLGLARLSQYDRPLIPWAWGLNGFASVLAAPLAHVIAMTWGFSHAAVMALLMYLVAGVTFDHLGRPR